MNETNGRLRALLDIAVGEPIHDVTIGAVRWRVSRRRRTAVTATLVAAVLFCGAGAAVSAAAGGAGPATSRATVPKPAYYLEEIGSVDLVRSTATGTVTARPRCPWRGASIQGVAVSDNETFFLNCQAYVKTGPTTQVPWTRIYRFQLSRTGRVRGYYPVPGSTLKGYSASEIAAAPDGSELALAVLIGDVPWRVYVINASSGTRALWTEGNGRPSQVRYGVESLSFTGNGRELTFLAQSICAVRSPGCKSFEDVRALNPLARGGSLTTAKVLWSLSSMAIPATGEASDLIISPDGSVLTLVIQRFGSPPSSTLSVIQVSVRSGRELRALYRRVAPVASQVFFNTDPSGQYFLLGYQDVRSAYGWLTQGKIVHLPGSGSGHSYVSYEIW